MLSGFIISIIILIILMVINHNHGLQLTIIQENNEKIINLSEIFLYQNSHKIFLFINITIEFSGKYIYEPYYCLDNDINTFCHNGEFENDIFIVTETSPKLIINTNDLSFDTIQIKNRNDNKDRILNATLVVSDNNVILLESKFNDIQDIYTFKIDTNKIEHLTNKVKEIEFPIKEKKLKSKVFYNLTPGLV